MARQSERRIPPQIDWAQVPSRFPRWLFFAVVILSGISVPIIEYSGDFVTLFDLALFALLVQRLAAERFQLARTHWTGLAIAVLCYLLYLIPGVARVGSPFAVLLLIKHLEHLVFILIVADFMESSTDRARDTRALIWCLISVIIYQLLYQIGMVPGIGETYRLGLPFMTGVSSNPAGFFLAGTIVVLYHVGYRGGRRFLPATIGLALAACALVQTDSRTNMLALIIVLAVSVIHLVWRSRWRWVLIPVAAALIVAFYIVPVEVLPRDGSVGRIVQMLRNPALILDDRSFSIRVRTLWPIGFAGWYRNAATIWFGNGLGYFDVIDGTVPRLLGEQGVIGLVFFAYIWFAHYAIHAGRKPVVMLLLLAAINGITVETLIVSYRSIQLFIVLLMIAAYAPLSTGPDPAAALAHREVPA